MVRARTLFSTTAFALTTACGAAAQAGVADLRYVFPLPTSVVFTAVDTMQTTITGMQTGDSKMTTTMHSVSELRFAPGDSGIAVTAALRSFSGITASAVGDLPMKTVEVPPIRFRIDATGAAPAPLAAESLAAAIAAPEKLMAVMRARSGLFRLPGRQIRLGESWSDTARVSRPVADMKIDKLTITRGTYVADSVAGGRTLNVLRVITESTSTNSGTHQGMAVTQTSTDRSDQLVLWDSGRHIPVFQEAQIHIDTKTELKQLNITTRSITTSRSIITSEAQN